MTEIDTPGHVFARRLREVREARGWSQRQLAERLQEMGETFDAVRIAKIERGGRPDARSKHSARRVTIDEMFLLASALGVSPLSLLFDDVDTPLRIAPKLTLETAYVIQWVVGELPLRRDDVTEYISDRDASAWFNWFDWQPEDLSMAPVESLDRTEVREALSAYIELRRTMIESLERELRKPGKRKPEQVASYRTQFEEERSELDRLEQALLHAAERSADKSTDKKGRA
jgi:transcriptional regulator with XRE-family HTH domain